MGYCGVVQRQWSNDLIRRAAAAIALNSPKDAWAGHRLGTLRRGDGVASMPEARQTARLFGEGRSKLKRAGECKMELFRAVLGLSTTRAKTHVSRLLCAFLRRAQLQRLLLR